MGTISETHHENKNNNVFEFSKQAIDFKGHKYTEFKNIVKVLWDDMNL